tara:strand:- start:41 stop:277 length:237 start_codon:yes stop_codon:yes gene_type:complete
MSNFMDDLNWDLDRSYGSSDYSGGSVKRKSSKSDPKSLGGYERWTDAKERKGTTKESKGKEFLGMFKEKFKDKFRPSR